MNNYLKQQIIEMFERVYKEGYTKGADDVRSKLAQGSGEYHG